MKKTIRTLCVILSVVMLVLCVAGCGSKGGESKGGESSQKITSATQAVRAVKNYMSGTAYSIEQRIASKLGFNNFYSPAYGTESAKQNSDGSWDVTINGKMSGYVDDYHSDFETYKFEVTAKVSEDGDVSRFTVKKVK